MNCEESNHSSDVWLETFFPSIRSATNGLCHTLLLRKELGDISNWMLGTPSFKEEKGWICYF